MSTSGPDERKTGARSIVARGLHWPILVGIVFLSNAALAAWVIVAASSDPSFGVERDYYQKALRWNDEIDQRARNEALGWSIVVDGEPRIAPSGASDVSLRVADRDGAPVGGARVEVEAIPIARSREARTLALDETRPGVYAARIEGARAGRWELRVRVERAGDVFTDRVEATIGRAR